MTKCEDAAFSVLAHCTRILPCPLALGRGFEDRAVCGLVWRGAYSALRRMHVAVVCLSFSVMKKQKSRVLRA